MNSIGLSEINKIPEFENLFSKDQNIIDRISDDMQKNGFDPAFPVILGKVGDSVFLVDGHQRIQAASDAGIKEIPFKMNEYESINKALHHAVRIQRDRRNITDAEIWRQIEAVDDVSLRGYLGKIQGHKGKSASRTGRAVGVSTRKVEASRYVRKRATTEQKEEIQSGKKTINQVYNEIRGKSGGNNKGVGVEVGKYDKIVSEVMFLTGEIIPGVFEISDQQNDRWERGIREILVKELGK